MKTIQEVEEALKTKYNGPIEEMDGFSYIPWHVSTKLANEIFGPLGWDSVVKSCVYTEIDQLPVDLPKRDQNGNYLKNEQGKIIKETVHMDFRGFMSIVTVRVRVWDEVHGMVITTEHDGVGYGVVQGMGNKNPMDGASKSAKSDGISTAIKHYGDAFGLFLYEKENKQQTSSGNGNGGYNKQSSGGGSDFPPSEKQAAMLKSKMGFNDAQIAKMPKSLWKPILDELFAGVKQPDIRTKYATQLQAIGIGAPKGDGLPIPA